MSNVDAGTDFGLWPDETSRLMYHAAMPALLVGTDRSGWTLDLGGGNGLSRQWFDLVVTVDSDAGKHPDVVANITTWKPLYPVDRVLLRYVLHYLSDFDVCALMAHIASYHHGPLTVIQFVNDDLGAKLANSVNEDKWFRSEEELRDLLRPWQVQHRVAVEYEVVPEFYANRLGHPNPTGHRERVVAYDLTKDTA